ncbi:MAG TPA: dihydrolipoamide acetyltransferase family protein [Actinomycetota bacterium]|jgi:pyruvate dehydrogenase E2 component (dihydrolipoamide acetyltransferase)
MVTELVMPALGVAQETGKLLRWLKAEGEEVAAGEPVMEIETDKVTVEIEAPAAGTLAHVRASEGEEVPVGQVVAVILAPGESGSGASSSEAVGPRIAEATRGDGSQGARAPGGQILASPLARRRAREAGIDLSALAGTGPQGAITQADVEAALAEQDEPRPAERAMEAESRPEAAPVEVSQVWRRMAERTTASWTTTPHFYLQREALTDQLLDRRQALLQSGRKVTVTDFLVKLVATALAEHPEMNTSWEGQGLVRHRDVNVGMAVATDAGLFVPVIPHADALTVGEIAARRRDLVARAQEGALRLEDVQGGTFTVSNLGMFGVDAFTAVINRPQTAILAVGRVTHRVVAVDGRPEVRPTVFLTLGCDHRAVDGARGARFLGELVSLIEKPPEFPP